MSRDWNIVNDEAEPEPVAREDDSRLNLERVHTIARERRAADRVRLWCFGAAAALMLASLILTTRSVGWLISGEHRAWALSAMVVSLAMIIGAMRSMRGLSFRS